MSVVVFRLDVPFACDVIATSFVASADLAQAASYEISASYGVF
jgi:hypothetical protein